MTAIWRALGPWGRVAVGVAIIALIWLLAGAVASAMPLDSAYKRNLAAGMLRLVVLTVGVGWVVLAVPLPRSAFIEPSARIAWLVTGAGMLAYSAGLSWLSLFRHRALLTGLWDLGYYTQLVWYLGRLETPRSSLWSDAPWGNHGTFILVAAAPWLRILPDAETLLVLQSIVLALGAVPAYALGRRIWGQPLAGAVAAFVYLLYPPLQFSNLFDFHADAFATPIMLAAFAAAAAGRFGWACAFAGLLAVVKEDMTLVTLTFGLYLALRYRWRPGWLLAAGAAAVFVLLVWVIVPGITQVPYVHLDRWPHLGPTPWEIAASPLLRPRAFFGTLLGADRLGYLLLLLAPVGFVPLLAPEILAVGLPPLALNLLSATEAQYTIRAQYTALLTPIVVAAAIVGGRRAARSLERSGVSSTRLLAGLGATAVVASIAFSPLPWSRDPAARKQFWDVAPRRGLTDVAAHLPPDASLSASNHLGAHFALRPAIVVFPEMRDTADFVLVDISGLDYVGAQLEPELFRDHMRSLVATRPLVARADGLALFGRGTPSPDTVAQLMNLRATAISHAGATPDLMPASVVLAPRRVAPRANLHARYTWVAVQTRKGLPCVSEALVDATGAPAWERRRPIAFGLLRGDRWPRGGTLDEAVLTVVPETVRPGRYAWTVATWHAADPEACTRVPHAPVRIKAGDVAVAPW